MKTQTSMISKMTLVAVLIAVSLNLKAAGFEEAMGKALQDFGQAADASQLLAVADQFERIGNVESTQWLPFYYASFVCVNVVMRNREIAKEERIQLLDRAQTLLDKSMKVNSKESENFVLQALIYQMMIINPMDGATLSIKANTALGKAEVLNPNNPRVYYSQGNNTFYTPKAFGGGAESAKPLFEKAQKLFEAQQVSNQLLPNWGKEHNAVMLQQCQ